MPQFLEPVTPEKASASIAFDLFDDGDRDAESEKEKVQSWLKDLGLGRYTAQLQDEGFDHFSIIRNLDDDNIDELIKVCNMPRLHARQFRLALDRMREEQPVSPCKVVDCKSPIGVVAAPKSDAAETVSALTPSADGADEAGGIGTSVVSETRSAETRSAEAATAGSGLREDEDGECGAQLSSAPPKAVPKKVGIVLNTKYSKLAEKKQRKKANKKAKEEEEWTCFEADLAAV
mmetsp:Transcript_89641/g.158582  ORF Transcript_89641/g.158582 Transcript_89641/m.158582 type:complete len:233 (-) Transcript_89641:45-743(-)